MKRFALAAFLVLSGLLLLSIGGLLLFEPHWFFAENGVVLGSDPNLMSEIRAPAGLLLVSGVLIMLGAVVERLTSVGLGLAALVYGTYGVSRLVSIGLDGMPSEGIIAVMVIELVVGALALLAIGYRHAMTAAR